MLDLSFYLLVASHYSFSLESNVARDIAHALTGLHDIIIKSYEVPLKNVVITPCEERGSQVLPTDFL